MENTTIAQEILDSFIYETVNGQFMATDPTEFDQVIPGGPWSNRNEAEQAFNNYVNEQQITFE
jgi:hypothetical protein